MESLEGNVHLRLNNWSPFILTRAHTHTCKLPHTHIVPFMVNLNTEKITAVSTSSY